MAVCLGQICPTACEACSYLRARADLMRVVRRQIRQICPSVSCLPSNAATEEVLDRGVVLIEELACVLLSYCGRTFRLGEVKMRAFPRDEFLATEELVRYPFETVSGVGGGGQRQRVGSGGFLAPAEGRASHPALLANGDQAALFRISLCSFSSV